MVENTDIIRNNFDNILKDFEKIGIYNYNKEDLDKITENMFIFSYIIIQILSILKNDTLTSDQKQELLSKIKLDDKTSLTNDTIKTILDNEEHYINMNNIFNRFKKFNIQEGGKKKKKSKKDKTEPKTEKTKTKTEKTEPKKESSSGTSKCIFISEEGEEDVEEDVEGDVEEDVEGEEEGSDKIFRNIPLLNKIPEFILFPLAAIEDNIPITQLMFQWLLFFSTIIGVFTKIIAPFVAGILKFGSDMLWTFIGAIPLFGLDPLVAALSIPLKYGFSFFIKFVVGIIEALPNLFKFVIQISRKNFGDALQELSRTTLIFTQLYNLIEKALPLLNDNLMYLKEYVPVIIKISEPFASLFLKTLSSINTALVNLTQKNKQ